MKAPALDFPRLYETALRSQLEHGVRHDLQKIGQTGGQIHISGLPLLDFARLHDHVLVMEFLAAYPARKRPVCVPVSKTMEKKWREESVGNESGKS